MDTLNMSQKFEKIAEHAHEANRVLCKLNGDDSQPRWADAPEWQRKSSINGVVAVFANPEMTPEESHKSWMKEKVDEGWVYGETKDPEKKTHPCIVEYSKLPENQRVKDAVYVCLVRSAMIVNKLI